jgi:PAS domain S-box-containing protein
MSSMQQTYAAPRRMTEFEALLAAGSVALDAIPGAVYLCDRDGLLVCYNSEAAALWGREPGIDPPNEYFCGSHRLYLPDGTLLPRSECPMANAIQEGVSTRNAEIVIERPDGSRLTALVNIRALRDEHGNVQGAINCFQDISARKAMEAELARQKESLEDFFENSAVGLHIVSSDGIVLRANKAELDMLGYSREEYIGRPIADFHADADVIADIIGRLSKAETLERYPARLRAKDGSIRHVLITSNGRIDDDDGLLHTRCFTLDVTELRNAEIARRKMQDDIEASERRLRELLEALPAAVYTTDAQGLITFYNDAAVELAGRRPELGDAWCVSWRLYHPDGTPLPHDECPMAVCLKEGRMVRGGQAIAERPDGSRVPFMAYPTPLRNADGELVGAINMLVDISSHKQAEARQKALIDELNHRVKNTLATVQSLARRSARHASNLQEFGATFDARILGLARAHDLLSRRYWVAVAMQNLVQDIVAPYADTDGRVRADGPALDLNPRAALSLAMALNELVTNAAKYGALSVPSGAISVHWNMPESEAAMMRLEWIEEGGPPVAVPPRRGFGTVLLERCIERDLDGRCDLRFDAGGVRCRMSIPFPQLVAHE